MVINCTITNNISVKGEFTMAINAQTVTERIMNEISVNEHFVDELRNNPSVALSKIGLDDVNAKKALNDVNWDAPDVSEQLKDRISKFMGMGG